MTEETRFHWKQSNAGYWHRDIDECEQFYQLYAKKEHGCYPVTACASFQVKDASANLDANVESALRNAWIFLRHKHPTLGSHIECSDQPHTWKRLYKPFDTDEDVKSWLDSTFKIINTNKSALSWFNDEAPSFNLPTVYMAKSGLDAHQTVVLRCPHDITDGVGVLQLLGQLFKHASSFYKQANGFRYPLPDIDLRKRLSPSLRVAASIPDLLSEDQTKRFQELQTTNGSVYNHPCWLNLPPSASNDSASVMKRIAISSSQSLSSEILAGCKNIAPGVSLTHVFTASLTMALRELQPRQEQAYTTRYIGRSMINIHPYCLQPFNSPDHAAAAYHAVSAQALGIDVKIPSSADDGTKVDTLSELAIKVRDFYQQIKPNLSNDTYEQALFAPQVFQTLFPPPGVDPWAVQKTPFCPVSLSSIGNLSTIVGSSDSIFELSKVWAASQPINAGVVVFLGSWDGQIELSSVFNTQYHNEEYMERFITKILTHVFEGLGIDGGNRVMTVVK
ncbi:hypothetical protein FVEN_g903 [Fusarium venenatum]|uniref:Condensation domain-containing protein n=2 Tax=Fusarium venenatum TaxID=56646 RepID=A0A2L2TX21_9HYPO|nr:uncharacterized protein FVRRES_10684 [Fusarium venenatum]KAG8361190.1 hypothetical protein FVEN_g903 [Fusarium venenatum]CEI70607.1 unnamed protein product [Fusarium venenatum]